MHNTWSSIEEVPYCFSRSSAKFQGPTGQKKNRRFLPKLGVSGLQLQFELMDGCEMMHKAWSSMEKVAYCFSRSSVKFQGHTGSKIADFGPNWVFLDCNSSLNWLMATKWCMKLKVAQKRYPVVLQVFPSNFRVTQGKKLPNFTQIGHFRTVTPVWIHWWIWNNGQSLT